MNIKRYYLWLILVLIGFSACSPQPVPILTSTQPAETSKATQTANITLPTETPAPEQIPQVEEPLLDFPLEELDQIQLFFWHPWTGKMAEEINAIVQDFNQSNLWGIEVFTSSSGGYSALSSKFEENIEIDNIANVLAAPSEQLLFWQQQHSLFVDLSTYVNAAQLGMTTAEKSSIPLTFWEQDQLEETQVGMPALRDLQVMFYNQTWGKELGFFTPPQTFDGFAERACAAAEQRKNIDETGGWILDTSAATVLNWIMTRASVGVFESESGEYHFNEPEVVEMFTQLHQLFGEGCAWRSRLPDSAEYFADRQALIYSGSLQEVLHQASWMQKKGSPDEWLILPFPVNDGKPVVLSYGVSYAVQETTPQEHLASWLFIRWLTLPRNQARLTEISGMLPANASLVELSPGFTNTYPQWESALVWVPLTGSAPNAGSWTVVQNILEDAAWQVFQPFTETDDIESIMNELDLMVPEVLNTIDTD